MAPAPVTNAVMAWVIIVSVLTVVTIFARFLKLVSKETAG
jgi:hypothetical protein